MEQEQRAVQQPPQKADDLSRELLVAQRTYHLIILNMHLESIKMFLAPIVDDVTYEHTEKLIDMCQESLAQKSTKLMDSLLEHMVEQVVAVNWKKRIYLSTWPPGNPCSWLSPLAGTW